MARRVRLSARASADLQRIAIWYSQPGSGGAAQARLDRIARAIATLGAMPCAFRVGTRPGTRQMLRAEHRFIFRVQPDTGDNRTAGDVLVLRVLGPGQEYR